MTRRVTPTPRSHRSFRVPAEPDGDITPASQRHAPHGAGQSVLEHVQAVHIGVAAASPEAASVSRAAEPLSAAVADEDETIRVYVEAGHALLPPQALEIR